jgi:hypothetical protein
MIDCWNIPNSKHSATFRQWVVREEVGQPFCHALRVDELQPVGRAREHESL